MTTAVYQIPCPRLFCGGQLKRDPESGELGCLLCSRVSVVVDGIARPAEPPEMVRTWPGHKPRVH